MIQEKRERAIGIRAVAEIPADYRQKRLDPEEFHERSELNIPQPSVGRLTASRETVLTLSRLSITKDLKGQISHALAWDDLFGMALDVSKVIEARAKEVQYVREKRFGIRLGEVKRKRKGGRLLKPGGRHQ